MTTSAKASLWNRLAVGKKLAIIPAMFILAIAGILMYTVNTTQQQKDDVFVVNMTARQRMLIHRQFVQALLVAQGFEVPRELPANPGVEIFIDSLKNANYLATRRLASDTIRSLLEGGPILDLFAGTYRQVPPVSRLELRDKLSEHQGALTAYAKVVDELLQAKPTDPDYRAKLQATLAATATTATTARNVNGMYAANLESRMAAMTTWETVVGIVVSVLGAMVSWIIARGIVGPLGGVVDIAQEISQGNLTCEKLNSTSHDEIGQLAGTFNDMLDGLRALAGQTASVTSNLNAAAAEILASTQQQATSTKEQAATIQQITATMDEVRQSGVQIAERAKHVAAAAEATASSSVAGLGTVRESNRSMEAIRQQVEDVAENIVALSEKTQAVSEIIATVNDIAERSNLLALNAAIEAAAAGEQGNRFSVVANEIKNLADQAKESTFQVRTILGDIQKRINQSVMLTEEAVKRAEIGKQQADTSEQAIRSMASTTQESVQAFQQIIGATGQQQIGFDQVTQGMQDIEQAASQTAAGTVQLEKAVASLNSQSHQLREAVGRYKL
jgi:methyl-accepting chemotaxis protein